MKLKDLSKLTREGYFNSGELKLHYIESGWENDRLVLMVHGFPDFWYSWRYQIPKLAEKYHVVAIDQRGYNKSSKPKSVSAYSIDLLAGDILQVPAHFHKSIFSLVGHDWGGAVSWEFANRYPTKLDQLIILNCPPVQVLLREQMRNGKQLKSSYYIYLFQIPWLPEYLLSRANASFIVDNLPKLIKNISKDEMRMYKRGLGSKNTMRSGINYYRCAVRQFLLKGLSGKSGKVEINVPTKVIWGVRDSALQTSLTSHFPKICKIGYHIKYIDAGHFVHQEKPALVNKILLEYLKKQ